jgi:hypothetical protein
VAPPRLARWRFAAVLVAAAVLGWVVWQTIHAGAEIPSQRTQLQTRLSGGSANDKRIDGKSWSLDYDTATLSTDGSVAEIDRVHDGVILRNGKPYMHMAAQHVSANLTYNDFVVTGPVSFAELGGQHRRLDTDSAHYSGVEHTLYLNHPTTIHENGVTVRVTTASVNFANGETKIGRLVGTM